MFGAPGTARHPLILGHLGEQLVEDDAPLAVSQQRAWGAAGAGCKAAADEQREELVCMEGGRPGRASEGR